MRMRNESASRLESPGGRNEERNRLSLVRLAIMVATTIMLGTLAPPGLAIAAISSLAFLSAVVVATFALVYSERATGAEHFTRWDEAAVMMALGLGAGLFVDPVAVQTAVSEAVRP